MEKEISREKRRGGGAEDRVWSTEREIEVD